MGRKPHQIAGGEHLPRRAGGKDVSAASPGGPTLVCTLLRTGRFQEAVLTGEEDLKNGTLRPDGRRCLARAYWALAMGGSAARMTEALLAEAPDLELLALRAEIAVVRGELDAARRLSALAALEPAHPLLTAAAGLSQPPAADAPDSDLAMAEWHLRRGDGRSAEPWLARAEARAAGVARSTALRWAWSREQARYSDVQARAGGQGAPAASTVLSGRVTPGAVMPAAERATTAPANVAAVVGPGQPGFPVETAQEEDVASENNGLQVTAASTLEDEEFVVEAGADDEEGDADHYVLPNGIGAISLNFAVAARQRQLFGSEDDEVVVIEREDRPRVLRGDVDIWIRGRSSADLSWRTGVPVRNPMPDTSIGQYGFDDEDEVATEVARFTADGQLEIRRKVQLKPPVDDEDQEIIIPSQRTVPPGTPAFEPEEEGPTDDGSTRILSQIEAATHGADSSRSPFEGYSDPTVMLPGAQPGGDETRRLEAYRGTRDERTAQLPNRAGMDETARLKRPGAGASPHDTTARIRRPAAQQEGNPDDEETRIVSNPDEDLELDEVTSAGQSTVVRARAVDPDGPAARLAPTPAAPLQRSAPPPLTSPPVPQLPSQLGGVPRASLDLSRASDEPVAQRADKVRPGPQAGGDPRRAGPQGRDRAAGAATPLLRQDYFRKPDRFQKTSRAPYLAAGILSAVVILGGYLGFHFRQGAELSSLRSQVGQAAAAGTVPEMKGALAALQGSPLHTDPEIANLEAQLTWTLWAEEGIKTGETPPDPATLEGVAPESALPLVVARAERDLQRGDLIRGEQFTRLAAELHGSDPLLLELYARFALERANAHQGDLAEARERYQAALKALEQPGDGVGQGSKARVLYGLAWTATLAGDAGAPDLFKGLVANEPQFQWGVIGQGIAAIPADATSEQADAALKTLLEQGREAFSPRQKAAVQRERARRALVAGDLEGGRARLGDARNADPTDPEAARMLGQLALDQGQAGPALKVLEAAYALAPENLDVVDAYVQALLASTRFVRAREVINKVPSAYQETATARLIKARIQREADQLPTADAQIGAALKEQPERFALKLELALLRVAQGSADAAKLLEGLLAEASANGRPALVPVLQAHLATLAPESSRAREIRQVTGVASGNARALLVLAESRLKSGDSSGAEKILKQAREGGDLPRISLLLARIASASSSRRSEALSLAQSVQSGCGEGPTCEEAGRLVEQLQ